MTVFSFFPFPYFPLQNLHVHFPLQVHFPPLQHLHSQVFFAFFFIGFFGNVVKEMIIDI